ncbi:MAG: hypothetical protein JNM92_07145 [Zoogloea sp.]|nr:hypothetical protein [Zoogloea sp.]
MQRLLNLDPRVLRLVVAAVLAMVLLVGWGQFLRPAWHAHQAAITLDTSTRETLADLPARRAQADALEKEVSARESRLDSPASAPTRLPVLLENLATARGVELQPVFPGREVEFEGLVETRYEIEAGGSYPRLAAWLADVDARLANAGIVEARFLRQAHSETVQLHLRLAVYRRPAQTREEQR